MDWKKSAGSGLKKYWKWAVLVVVAVIAVTQWPKIKAQIDAVKAQNVEA